MGRALAGQSTLYKHTRARRTYLGVTYSIHILLVSFRGLAPARAVHACLGIVCLCGSNPALYGQTTAFMRSAAVYCTWRHWHAAFLMTRAASASAWTSIGWDACILVQMTSAGFGSTLHQCITSREARRLRATRARMQLPRGSPRPAPIHHHHPATSHTAMSDPAIMPESQFDSRCVILLAPVCLLAPLPPLCALPPLQFVADGHRHPRGKP